MTIGERIKERRIELGLTQMELSQKMGYKNKSAICNVEKRGDNITSDRIEKLAAALECTPGYLMGWNENPYKYHLNSQKLQEELQFNGISIEELADKVDVIPVYMNAIIYN